MAWRGSSTPTSSLTVDELRALKQRDPQAILMLVQRLRMGELDSPTRLALAAALGEPDLAAEDVETVEAAIARMNARVRARPTQDFKQELEEAAARMASRARPAARPASPVAAHPRQSRARAPRARRVGARASARSPGSSSAADDPPSDLAVIPLGAFRLELDRALGERP
jgi:hypothetical protein